MRLESAAAPLTCDGIGGCDLEGLGGGSEARRVKCGLMLCVDVNGEAY